MPIVCTGFDAAQPSETASAKVVVTETRSWVPLRGEFRGSALEEPESLVCQACSERAHNSAGSTDRQ